MIDEHTPWEVLFFQAVEAASAERRYLGSRERPRTCCFCARSEPLVTFKKEAHVVPQAFGNRTLLSYEECDDCNFEASKLENHLVAVMTPARIVSVVGPRRPEWTFRHKTNSASAIRVRPGAYSMQIEPKPEDPTVRVRRTQHGVAVTTKIPPFSAYDVSRALARIAWFTFSPEMRQRASHLLPWIRDEVTWDATLLLVGALKVDAHGGTKGPILAVSIPKAGLRDDMPWFDVRLTLGRTVFATILPGPSLTMSVSNSDALAIIGRKGELKEDLESTFEFYSKKLASLPPPAHEEIARSAYARYLARGGVNGDARADWLEAEQELLWAQFEAVSEVDERSSPVEDKD